MNKNSFEKSRGVPLNVSVIIDGFNVYHFLKKDKSKKWLNYMELSRKILPNYNIKSVKYFTAQSTWNPKKTHRHNIYLRALQDAGVEVIMGKFQQKTKKVILDNKFGNLKVSFLNKPFFGYLHQGFTAEEKQTDVAIGVEMYRAAASDEIDIIALISGDTDFIPAIEAIKQDFPDKKLFVFIPAYPKQYKIPPTLRKLTGASNCRFLKNKIINKCIFPFSYILKDGSILKCPPEWR